MPNIKLFQGVFRKLTKLLGTARGQYHIVSLLARAFPNLRSYRTRLIDGSEIVIDLREKNCFEAFIRGTIHHETSEIKILQSLTKEGDIFVDVGANIGIYTSLAKKWVGPKGLVIALEPNPFFVKLLEKSFGSDPNVIIVPKGASNRAGKSVLYVPIEGGFTTIDKALYENNQEYHVEVTTIDNLIKNNALPAPSIIKIDVEGMELAVMQGMKNMFTSKYPPVVAFEYIDWFAKQFDSSLSKIIDFIQSQSREEYSFFRVDFDGKLRRKDINIATNQNDLVAIPNWRVGDINQNVFV